MNIFSFLKCKITGLDNPNFHVQIRLCWKRNKCDRMEKSVCQIFWKQQLTITLGDLV